MAATDYVPAGMSLLAIGTNLLDQKSQAEATLNQMDLLKDEAIFSANMSKEQVEAISLQLSSVMSQSAIQALKDEATLQALSSSSGLSGSIRSDLKSEASTTKLARDNQAKNQAEAQASQALSGMLAKELQFKNQQASLADSLLTGTESFLKSTAVGIQGLNTGLSFLSPSQQNGFFGR
jgi:hypothetical protein